MKLTKSAVIFGFLAVISAGAAFAGEAAGNGLFLATGVTVSFLSLLMIPAFYVRDKRVQKIRQKENPIVEWEYSDSEAEDIAQMQMRIIRKQSIRFSLLISICLAVIFLPFYMLSLQENSTLPPMLPVALPFILLPWLSVLIAPSVVAEKVRQRPCVTLIGRDYVLAANRYLGVNDRSRLKAEEFKFSQGSGGAMSTLSVQYSFLAGRYVGSLFRLWVDIPVPHGREEEAKGLCV
ncbi:MAG: hypothetical protein ACYCX2_02660 [Christensenellales bacterium]